MGRCKNCKFWESVGDRGYYAGAAGFGECTLARTTDPDGKNERLYKGLAQAIDFEYLTNAMLICKPNFGCVLFKSKAT